MLPPLLLINGYAATGADWDPGFLAELGRSHRVISPDNRGMGAAPLGAEELTVELMAADMERLLDAEGIERTAVVGWSMGGFVAQELVRRSPQRVASLTLLDTDPGGAAAVPAAPDVWARLTDHTGTPREQASRLIALLFPPPLAAEIDAQFGEVVAAAREQLSTAALRAQEAAMAAWHRDEPAAGGQRSAGGPGDDLPVLVLHGTEDAVIPAANALALQARWPGAHVELFEGCGHALMAQDPQRVAELIRTHSAG
ncbi:MAG TPA: alpha/beta hydrolase [Solirubrobacterales bacterium]|nr:alpha/beta hydrolase [Solirubrobacterales bacterium]